MHDIQPIDFAYFKSLYFAVTTIAAVCIAAIGVMIDSKEF